MSEEVKEIFEEKLYPMPIAIYEVIYPEKKGDEIVALEIETNNFSLLMETGANYYELKLVSYEIFRQDQLYQIEIDEKIKELEEQESELSFDPTISAYPNNNQEEEMTSLRAHDLYSIVMQEWDNIVLGKTNGDFEHDLELDLAKSEYFDGNNAIVYQRAWEINDIITTLVEGKYQPKTLFGNYEEIYNKIITSHGLVCARNLVTLTRLMSRCVSPETVMRREEIVESTIPSSAVMRNA